MNRLGTLLGELHRRSVWQILGSYAVGAWIILQLAETLAGLIGLPLWFGPTIVVLILLGFPILLITSLVQGGRKKRVEGEAAESGDSTGEEVGAVRKVFSWKNAALAGLAGALFLGAGTAGYSGMRAAGIGPLGSLMAKGILETEERLILAEFDDRTPDGSLGETVTALFRIDLAQSPSVVLMEPVQLAPAFARMQREPSQALTADVALEMAQREGIKAVVTGEVLPLGAGAVISASLVTAATGETVVALKETARDVADIPDAVDQLSAQLRERIGESLRTIQGDPPLEQVTTASLQALQKYAQAGRANDRGDREQAQVLLEEALVEDSTFAMAWRKLGVINQNENRDLERAREAFTRAYGLRDRLTDRERLLAEAAYHTYVGEEPQEAILVYERLLEEYPTDRIALNNLAVAYGNQDRQEEAADLYLRSIRQGGAPAVTYSNAVSTLFDLQRADEANEVLSEYREAYPSNPGSLQLSASLSSSRFDYEAAEGFSRQLLEESSPAWKVAGFGDLANFAFVQGKPSEGVRHILSAYDLQEGMRGQLIPQPRPIFEGMGNGLVNFLIRQDVDAALASLDQGMAALPIEGASPETLAHLQFADLYARAGQVEKARERIAAYEAEVPEEVKEEGGQRSGLLAAQAAIAQAEGRHDEAVALLRQAREAASGCVLCILPELGVAFEKASLPDSAVRAYEDYLTTPFLYRAQTDNVNLHRVLLGLGRSYEALGQTDRALEHYRRFVELWANAEPELRAQVEEIRQRIQELERGSSP